jgi:flagellar hook-associated protein 3 FlgL
MRITNGMMINNMLYNVNQNLARLEKINQQYSTQKKFSLPSDDPIGVSKSLKFNTDLSKITQYKRNAEDADAWMTETESALTEIETIFQRANELAVQMANGTYKDDLKNTKEEIDQMKEHLIQISNTTYAGRYIFSGFKTDQPLLDDDGNYAIPLTMNGDNTEIFQYNVGVSESVKVNTLGGRVFGTYTTDASGNITEDFSSNITQDDVASGKGSYLVEVLQKFSDALGGTEPVEDEIQNTIGRIKTSLNQILSVKSEIGAKVNRLELTQKKLNSQVQSTKELISDNEDVDLFEIVISLYKEENVYTASLSAGAKIIQPSLLDFLS